jgi:hypothetical protein
MAARRLLRSRSRPRAARTIGHVSGTAMIAMVAVALVIERAAAA